MMNVRTTILNRYGIIVMSVGAGTRCEINGSLQRIRIEDQMIFLKEEFV